jgi:hypothetical protein
MNEQIKSPTDPTVPTVTTAPTSPSSPTSLISPKSVLKSGKQFTSQEIFELLKKSLDKKLQEELHEFGKSNKILSHDEFCKMKEGESQVEEKAIDSTLYNKALLERMLNREMNEYDIRMIIRRSIAREPPRKAPKPTKQEIEDELNKYDPKVIWATKVPLTFKGNKLDYLKFLDAEKATKDDIVKGKKKTMKENRAEYAKVVDKRLPTGKVYGLDATAPVGKGYG